MGKRGQRLKSLITRGIGVALCSYLGSQAINLAKFNEGADSKEATEFKGRFGTSLGGYRRDIQKSIGVLTEVMHEEEVESPFSLNYLHVNPKNLLEDLLPRQVFKLRNAVLHNYFLFMM